MKRIGSSSRILTVVAAFLAATVTCFSEVGVAQTASPSAAVSGARLDVQRGYHLYMTFQYLPQPKTVNWITCGSTPSSTGCYASGNLGPFGHYCALAASHGDIFIADADAQASGGSQSDVTIFSYHQTLGNGYTANNVLFETVVLPIVGNSTAKCFMAATAGALFFGTDTSVAYVISRSTFSVSPVPAISGSALSITANDKYASVSLTGGAVVFDQFGQLLEFGGDFTKVLIPGNVSAGVYP